MSAGARAPVVGLDIGGTKIAAALVDPDSGAVLAEDRRPTPAAGGAQAILAAAAGLAAAMRAAAGGRDVAGAGIGLCEVIDRDGRVASHALADWRGADWAQAGAGLPVRLVADVRAGALAELRLGAGRGAREMLYVSLGTGISACLVMDGAIRLGHRGAALAMGSGPASVPALAGAGAAGPLEALAAGPAIARAGGEATAEAVLARAEAGDPAARAVVGRAAAQAGAAIGQLASCTAPERIVLGGGLGCAGGAWGAALAQAIRAALWPGLPEAPRILPSALGARAGVIGAALAFAEGQV